MRGLVKEVAWYAFVLVANVIEVVIWALLMLSAYIGIPFLLGFD